MWPCGRDGQKQATNFGQTRHAQSERMDGRMHHPLSSGFTSSEAATEYMYLYIYIYIDTYSVQEQ